MREYVWKTYKVAGTDWEYWYDNRCRVWVATKRDSEGNQVGAAIDAHTKQQIQKYIQMEL